MIWILTIWLVIEALDRLVHPEAEIDAHIMLTTAILALICNIIMAGILHSNPGKISLHGHNCSGHHHHHPVGHGEEEHDTGDSILGKTSYSHDIKDMCDGSHTNFDEEKIEIELGENKDRKVAVIIFLMLKKSNLLKNLKS